MSIPAAVPSDPTKVHTTVLEDTLFNVLLGNVYFSGVLAGGATVERAPHRLGVSLCLAVFGHLVFLSHLILSASLSNTIGIIIPTLSTRNPRIGGVTSAVTRLGFNPLAHCTPATFLPCTMQFTCPKGAFAELYFWHRSSALQDPTPRLGLQGGNGGPLLLTA